jgi:hypothetical protein
MLRCYAASHQHAKELMQLPNQPTNTNCYQASHSSPGMREAGLCEQPGMITMVHTRIDTGATRQANAMSGSHHMCHSNMPQSSWLLALRTVAQPRCAVHTCCIASQDVINYMRMLQLLGLTRQLTITSTCTHNIRRHEHASTCGHDRHQ